MNFLNTAEKIKKIRKQLKINQEDLADENFTRAFISMVETGKRGISSNTAKILAEKLKNNAEKRGTKLDIDADYLLRDSRAEAEFYCTQRLEIIKEPEDVEEIIDIAKEYSLEKVLADAYKLLGDYYFSNNNFTESSISYTNSLHYYNNNEIANTIPYLLNGLGLCKLKQLEFMEALNYFNLANLHAVSQNNEDIKKRSLYNIAICNKKLNKIEDSLKSLDIFLSACDKEKDFSLYISSNILKATCFESQGLIDMSIELLTSLLKYFEDSFHPLLGLVYNDLGTLYLEKNDFNKSLDYFNLSYKIRKKVDKPMLGRTLIEKAFIYIKQNSYEQAISLLEEGVLLVSKNDDLAYQMRGYYTLADVYINLKLYGAAEKIYILLLDLVKDINDSIYKNEIIKIYVKLSCLYLDQGNNIKLQDNLHILNDITCK